MPSPWSDGAANHMARKRGIIVFKIDDRIRRFSRYGGIDYGTITRVDEDGTVWGKFDDDCPFVREGRIVRDLQLVEE